MADDLMVEVRYVCLNNNGVEAKGEEEKFEAVNLLKWRRNNSHFECLNFASSHEQHSLAVFDKEVFL